jgi:hypothetical protein
MCFSFGEELFKIQQFFHFSVSSDNFLCGSLSTLFSSVRNCQGASNKLKVTALPHSWAKLN